MECPFCQFNRLRIIAQNKYCVSIYDKYPISEEHALIIPKRHVASIFDLTQIEYQSLFMLLKKTRISLIKQFNLHSFNVGVNDGVYAGQTMAHTHMHLIPRYKGDVIDPRGGIRCLMPEKASYWAQI